MIRFDEIETWRRPIMRGPILRLRRRAFMLGCNWLVNRDNNFWMVMPMPVSVSKLGPNHPDPLNRLTR